MEREPVPEDVLRGEAAAAAQGALSNESILEQVFMHLEVRPLLGFSLVSKLWRSSARKVLREHKRCLAYMEGRDPAQELSTLNSIISDSPDLPYSGVAFRARQVRPVGEAPLPLLEDPAKVYPALLEKVTYRHLKIFWDTEVPSTELQLLFKVLVDKRAEVTELELCLPHFSGPSLKAYLRIEEDEWLPNLQRLDAYDMICGRFREQNAFEIIKGAPKLKKLVIRKVEARQVEFYVRNDKVKLVSNLSINQKDFAGLSTEDIRGHPIVKFISSGPKLTYLRYSDEGGDEGNREVLRELFHMLLASVASSLKILELDVVELLLLPSLPLEPLKAVRFLAVTLEERDDGKESPLLPLLAGFDWCSWFPCLESVAIAESAFVKAEWLSSEMRLELEKRQRPLSPSLTASELSFAGTDHLFSNALMEGLPRFREIFLVVSDVEDLADKLRILWGCSFSHLESINIRFQMFPQNIPNLDSVFCGITKEQAAAYESLSAEDLRKEKLVSKGPSILSLKTLKKFTLDLIGGCSCCERGNGAPFRPCLFTHVTTTLAFEVLPELEVKIQLGSVDFDSIMECDICESYLEHLSPYLVYEEE